MIEKNELLGKLRTLAIEAASKAYKLSDQRAPPHEVNRSSAVYDGVCKAIRVVEKFEVKDEK